MSNIQRCAVTAKDRVVLAGKNTMHPHRGYYDFRQPVAGTPDPATFVPLNDVGGESFNVLTLRPSRP